MKDKFDKFRSVFGKDEVDDFLAIFGLGPKYVHQKPKRHNCPKCGEKIATYKEIHPDTDMNEIVLWCPVCGEVDDFEKT